MVKQMQTNRRQEPMKFLSVFNHFVGLGLKGIILLKKTPTNLHYKFEYHGSY